MSIFFEIFPLSLFTLMFSIVIPLYNKKEFIERTVQSVLTQSFKSFELIIVDDGSTDGGADLVQAKFSDKRIKLIRQNNKGVSAARNAGIKSSRFSYVAFLDADDYWEENCLLVMEELVDEFPESDLYGVGYYEEYMGKKKFSRNWLTEGFRGFIPDYFAKAISHYLFSSSSTVVKKSGILKAGLFDERISSGEDLDTWFRMILSGKAVFYNAPFVHYIMDDQHASTKTLPLFKKHLVYYMVEKYYENDLPEAARKFFDEYILINLRPYYLTDIDYNRVVSIYNHTHKNNRPLRYNIIYLLPKSLMRDLYKIFKYLTRKNH